MIVYVELYLEVCSFLDMLVSTDQGGDTFYENSLFGSFLSVIVQRRADDGAKLRVFGNDETTCGCGEWRKTGIFRNIS